MELTIPPLFRLPHPLRRRHARHVGPTAPLEVRAQIPRQRTSADRTAEALVRRG